MSSEIGLEAELLAHIGENEDLTSAVVEFVDDCSEYVDLSDIVPVLLKHRRDACSDVLVHLADMHNHGRVHATQTWLRDAIRASAFGLAKPLVASLKTMSLRHRRGRDEPLSSALSDACCDGSLERARFVKEHWPDDVLTKEDAFEALRVCLMEAISGGHVGVVDFLVEEMGLEIARDDVGGIALNKALRFRERFCSDDEYSSIRDTPNYGLVRRLVQHGAKAQYENGYEIDSLEYSRYFNLELHVRLLLGELASDSSHDADLRRELIKAMNRYYRLTLAGMRWLYIVSSEDAVRLASALRARFALADTMLPSWYSRTRVLSDLARESCSQNRPSVLRVLIDEFDFNVRRLLPNTHAVETAVTNGHTEIVKTILSACPFPPCLLETWISKAPPETADVMRIFLRGTDSQ